MLERSELKHKIQVDSAGLMADTGLPASEFAIEVCREDGLDLSSHKSKPLTDSLIANSDLIVFMQQNHKTLLSHKNMVRDKEIWLLTEFCPGQKSSHDIADPYGRDKKTYETVYLEIKECIEGLLTYLSRK